MTAPTVSVVVPLYNGRDLIGACLDSVPDDAELIVVDDGSSDGAPDLVAREHPRATLLRNPANRGFGATANRGLAAATGDVRIVLNSDARLGPGAVDALASAFDDPAVGIAGPRLVFADGSHQVSAGSFPTVGSFVVGSFLVNDLYRRLRPRGRFRWELGMARVDHDHTHDVDWVVGACIAIRSGCFDATGGFDDAFRMYVEECDLCWRARAAGWRTRFVAEARVVHLGGRSGQGAAAAQAKLNLAGEERFMRRAYGDAAVRRWRLARIVSSAGKAVALLALSPFDARVRERARWHRSAVRYLLRAG